MAAPPAIDAAVEASREQENALDQLSFAWDRMAAEQSYLVLLHSETVTNEQHGGLAAITAGAAWRLRQEGHEIVQAGNLLRLASAGAITSGSHWLSLSWQGAQIPDTGVFGFPMNLRAAAVWNVTSPLDSVMTPAGRRTSAGTSLRVSGAHVRKDDFLLEFLVIEERMDWHFMRSRSHSDPYLNLALDFSFLRWTLDNGRALKDTTWDWFGVSVVGQRYQRELSVLQIWPLRVEGVPLPRLPVVVDWTVGYQETSSIGYSWTIKNENEDEVIASGEDRVYHDGPEVRSPYLELALYGGDQSRQGGMTIARNLMPTPVDSLALEDRVTTWIEQTSPTFSATASLFAADTTVWHPETNVSSSVLSFGGRLQGAVRIRENLNLGLDLELVQIVGGNGFSEPTYPREGFTAQASISRVLSL